MVEKMQFKGLEDIRENAKIAPDLVETIKRINKSTIMYEKAKMLSQSADESTDIEQAYLLYSRCVQICNLLIGCGDFKEFSKSDDATHFRQIVTHALKEFDRLENQLKKMYASIEADMTERKIAERKIAEQKIAERKIAERKIEEFKSLKKPIEKPIQAPPEIHPVDRPDFGNFIQPIQLMDYAERLGNTVLILDYRHEKQPEILLRDHNFVRVLPLDPTLLYQGMTLLQYCADRRFRNTIMEIQDFDVVVLMGDELEDPDATPFKKGTITKNLLDAITIYNSTNRLKKNPLLLEGGFKAWAKAYPEFVESDESTEEEDELEQLCPGLSKFKFL